MEDLQGEWLRIRAGSGKVGWIHRGEVIPRLPPELNTTRGYKPAGMTDEEWRIESEKNEIFDRSNTGGRG